MTYQILTCPNCGGRGCPTCQNTGKVRVAEKEMQKLKQMVGQLSSTQSQSVPLPNQAPSLPSSAVGTNLAGIIAFSLLSLLGGGAAASWYFLKTLKPFFAGLIAIFVLISAKLTLNQPFFQLQEPDDFLKATKSLQ